MIKIGVNMDLSKILPVILNLLQSGNQSPPPPPQNQVATEELPALDASNACWQLPNYDFTPSNYQQNSNIPHQQNFSPAPPQNQTPPQNNFLANIDINSLIYIITEIMKIFPKKKEEEPKEEKEVSPSYISNLQRTDRFTFD